MIDSNIHPVHRPVLTQGQRDAIRGVVERKKQLRRQIDAAREAHRVYITDLRVKLAALPTLTALANQYGVSEPLIVRVGRGYQYQFANAIDERAAQGARP